MVPFGETYRLYERGGAGICCDVDGVSLGPIKLVERSDEVVGKRYRICSAEVLAEALTAAYGPLPGEVMVYLARGIFRVTRSLEDGNLPLAMIKAVHLKFPEIAPENMAKLAIGDVEKAGFNVDQARDALGRWAAEILDYFSGSHDRQGRRTGRILTGNATFYDPPRGARTASGEPFDPNGQNAAMYQPDIHIGDVVRVQLQSDPSRYVDVTVNDHGPFAIGPDGHAKRPLMPHPENVIDLTKRSFRDLTGDPKIGKVRVIVTKIREKKKSKS